MHRHKGRDRPGQQARGDRRITSGQRTDSFVGDHCTWNTSASWFTKECTLVFMLRVSHNATVLSEDPEASKNSWGEFREGGQEGAGGCNTLWHHHDLRFPVQLIEGRHKA